MKEGAQVSCDATKVLDFVDEPLDQIAFAIGMLVVRDGYTNVYLRTQAAARTPDRLIFAPPFFAPAAC